MASEPDQHSSPASFYESPQAARHARPEEFLYLACLHEGTGVDEPDFLAVVDAEDGRIVHETPMPNVGDELHHFGWNRCSSACHGPDRSHLIVPGFRSSRIHVAQRRRRPAPAADREGDRAARSSSTKTGYTRPHTVHCMPGDNVVVSHARRRRRQRRRRLRRARRADVRGQGPLGERRRDARRFNYDFWYQPRKNVLVSSEFGAPNAYETGFDLEDVERRPLRPAGSTSGTSTERDARADRRPRRERAPPARGALAARPRRRAGLRRRGAVEHDVALPPRRTAAGPPTR